MTKLPSAPLANRKVTAAVSSTAAPLLMTSEGIDLGDLAGDEAQAVDLVNEVDQDRPPPGSRRQAMLK